MTVFLEGVNFMFISFIFCLELWPISSVFLHPKKYRFSKVTLSQDPLALLFLYIIVIPMLVACVPLTSQYVCCVVIDNCRKLEGWFSGYLHGYEILTKFGENCLCGSGFEISGAHTE
jgi:hypothetical protein